MNHLISEKIAMYQHSTLLLRSTIYRYTGNLITPEVIDWIWINKKRKKKKSNN